MAFLETIEGKKLKIVATNNDAASLDLYIGGKMFISPSEHITDIGKNASVSVTGFPDDALNGSNLIDSVEAFRAFVGDLPLFIDAIHIDNVNAVEKLSYKAIGPMWEAKQDETFELNPQQYQSNVYVLPNVKIILAWFSRLGFRISAGNTVTFTLRIAGFWNPYQNRFALNLKDTAQLGFNNQSTPTIGGNILSAPAPTIPTPVVPVGSGGAENTNILPPINKTMSKKILIILSITAALGIVIFLIYRYAKKEKEKEEKPKPIPAQITKGKLDPQKLAQMIENAYQEAKKLDELLSDDNEKKIFRQWLEREREYTLTNRDFANNMNYYYYNVVKTPVASLIRTFVLDEDGKKLSLDSRKRLAEAVDKNLVDLIK